MAGEQPAAHSVWSASSHSHCCSRHWVMVNSWSAKGPPSQVHKGVNMTRRSLIFVIAAGLATLGSSIVLSGDSDQALIKALDGAKLTLLQGIAQVAKGTEVPIEAKYQMVRGKLMLSIYTSAKGFDTAAEDNS